MKYKIGDKVKTVYGIGTIDKVHTGEMHPYLINTRQLGNVWLSESELQSIKRTIRDVKIGEKYVVSCGDEYKIMDIGTFGFIDEDEDYYTFDWAEKAGYKIKEKITYTEDPYFEHKIQVIEALIIELKEKYYKTK